MFHHIQRAILDKLATTDSLHYSEIKPDDLDGNVFGYHLKSVLSDNYILKNDDGTYSLSAKGRDYIVHRYEDSMRSAHSIFLIVVKNGDHYLLRRRKVQPMLGYTGFVHGEPDPDMSVIDAAKARLLDKVNLNIPLQIRGSALLTQYHGGELQSYSHAIILYGEANQETIKTNDATGENFWGTLDTTDDLLLSCHDILTMIDAGDTWLEKSYTI